MSSLFVFLAARDWRKLYAIHSFQGLKNAIIAIALQCTEGAGSTLAYIDYFDLYLAPERWEFRVLSNNEWLEMNQALQGLKWHSFDEQIEDAENNAYPSY